MASALDTARATIEARIDTLWERSPGVKRTPIAWQGRPFTAPSDGSFIAPAIIWGSASMDAMDGLNTITGVLNLNLFARPGDGLGDLYRLADNARDMFNRIEVSGVRFEAPDGPVLVQGGDERWVQFNVSCAFAVEETVT